jgi:CBS domain-containing protein
MKVSEVMTRDPEIIKADETVLKAAETLVRKNIGALPVEKDDRLIGILTDRDIVVRARRAGIENQSAVEGTGLLLAL